MIINETVIASKTHALADHIIKVEFCSCGLSYLVQTKIDGKVTSALESYSTRQAAYDAFELMNEMAHSLAAVIK